MLRKYDEAEPALKRALAILDRPDVPGREHTADVLANLGKLYFLEGRDCDSAGAYKRAIEIQEAALGAESTRLIPVLESYANVLRHMKEFAQAEKADVRALGIRVRATLRAQ
jgi:tetratricopeptide (TPR) repeat protein